jgi:hypothetical protein
MTTSYKIKKMTEKIDDLKDEILDYQGKNEELEIRISRVVNRNVEISNETSELIEMNKKYELKIQNLEKQISSIINGPVFRICAGIYEEIRETCADEDEIIEFLKGLNKNISLKRLQKILKRFQKRHNLL